MILLSFYGQILLFYVLSLWILLFMESQLLPDDPDHSKRPSLDENSTIYPISPVNTPEAQEETEAQEEWDELSAVEGWDELSGICEAIYLSLSDAVPTAPLEDIQGLDTFLNLNDDPLLSTDALSATEVDSPVHPDVIAKYVDQMTELVDWQGIALENRDSYGLWSYVRIFSRF